MRICFITSEVFLGRRRGGFGRLVRILGRELTKRGFEVHVLSWRELSDEEYPSIVDRMHVWTYKYNYASRSVIEHIRNYTEALKLIRQVKADVYVSIECMVETLLTMRVHPRAKHIIWAQDPFDEQDHKLLNSVDPLSYTSFTAKDWLRFQLTRLLYSHTYRQADLIFTQARYYIPKIWKLYRVDPRRIVYLPNPIDYIPDETNIRKSDEPLVVFLGRFDPQKRFWIVPKLAMRFPDVKFIMIGRPSDLYERWACSIISKYRHLRNLEIRGFVSEEEKHEILSKAWILLLPSIREGLPIAFLEALAHKCALLSTVNPDNIVSRYGFYAKEETNIGEGLSKLLNHNLWRIKGEKGYQYVAKVHILNRVIERFIKLLSS